MSTNRRICDLIPPAPENSGADIIPSPLSIAGSSFSIMKFNSLRDSESVSVSLNPNSLT